ncbi:MAG TPA: AMP-binding protein, partial [Chroococcales cyanobacterium]
FVSWMPLYHDLGLVGAWLGSLYFGMLAVLFSPLTFLGRPERWLWAISEHRGTLTAAPNFAYELCARRLQGHDLEGLNLDSLRLAICGAELISPATTERFIERFEPYGFKPESFTPAYGLAESTVGLTLTPPHRGPRIDRIERALFQKENRAVPAAPDDPNAVRIVSCGKPLPGSRIRIVDPEGRDLPERTVGRLEFRGPSSTCGYYRNPEATLALFDDGWLDSGDLAYLAGGEVYLTGRTKDLIIRGGQHFFPDELEERIGDLPEIAPGGVGVFGVDDPVSGTERIVVFAETMERDRQKLEALRKSIGEKSLEVLGNPAEILFGPPQSLPKTASGKIRRSTSRALYLKGKLGTRNPVWRQLGELLFESLVPLSRRARRRVGEVFYAGYAWFFFGFTAPLTWFFIALLPSIDRRRRLLRAIARFLIRVFGLTPEVQGLEKLNSCHPCVLVSNHQSFLDSLLLAALLSPDTVYTPGREFNRFWISKIFLERLGVQFVERLDPRGGAKDIERLSGEIEKGKTVMVFPEGAIYPEPGLRPFRMGAFLAAARAGVPVLPMGIRGSRSVLPPKSWFPHRGKVSLIVGDPIMPEGSTWSAAARLHEQAFEAVMRLCQERAIEA